ncbi:MAG: hypothetical protein ACLFUV_05870, partial [Methanomassiliicoccales archaeon]
QYQQPPQQYQQPPQQYQQPPQQYQQDNQQYQPARPKTGQQTTEKSKQKHEMVKCKNCGVQYPAFMRTCPNCGEPR